MSAARLYGGFQKLGAFFGSPYTKSPTVLGSILGPLIFGISHMAEQFRACWRKDFGELLQFNCLLEACWRPWPFWLSVCCRVLLSVSVLCSTGFSRSPKDTLQLMKYWRIQTREGCTDCGFGKRVAAERAHSTCECFLRFGFVKGNIRTVAKQRLTTQLHGMSFL